MAAYLRSLFGSNQSPTPVHGKAKSRSRTESSPAPSPFYVQTPAPGSTPSTSTSRTSLNKGHRANSYNTPAMVSSPLRYPTYDSRHSHEDSRPPLYRAASHKPHQPDMHGPCHLLLPLTHISSSEAHIRSAAAGRLPQYPQGGYVTPGSSRSNSTSSLYPGPVHGTPFVPSPLVPSPPRSKTSDDDLPSKPPAQNKAWQVGVSTSASGSSTCTFFSPVFYVPSHRNLTCLLPHRWPGTITLAISSPRTALPHAPPSVLYPAPPRAHLLRHRIHALRAHRRRSHCALAPPSRHTSAAGDGAADPSELAARPALAEAALGRRCRTDRLAADVLHRQRRREAQGEELGGAHESRRALRRALDPHDLRHAGGVAFARGGLARAASRCGGVQGAVYAHGRRVGRRRAQGRLAWL